MQRTGSGPAIRGDWWTEMIKRALLALLILLLLLMLLGMMLLMSVRMAVHWTMGAAQHLTM
jgi:hypothetical protein